MATTSGDDAQFGPLFFERSHPEYLTVIPGFLLLAASVVMLVVHTCMLVGNPDEAPTAADWMIAVAPAVPGAALVALAYRRRYILRFHQRGIVRRPHGERGRSDRLAYDQIEGIAFRAVRQRTKGGVYSHTDLFMTMVPAPELGLTLFRYWGKLKENRKGFFNSLVETADELDAVNAAICERLARKLVSRIDAGETVAWTSDLSLSPQGLVTPDGTVPYGELESVKCDTRGVLAIFSKGERVRHAGAEAGQMDFLPGFSALGVLKERAPSPGA